MNFKEACQDTCSWLQERCSFVNRCIGPTKKTIENQLQLYEKDTVFIWEINPFRLKPTTVTLLKEMMENVIQDLGVDHLFEYQEHFNEETEETSKDEETDGEEETSKEEEGPKSKKHKVHKPRKAHITFELLLIQPMYATSSKGWGMVITPKWIEELCPKGQFQVL